LNACLIARNFTMEAAESAQRQSDDKIATLEAQIRDFQPNNAVLEKCRETVRLLRAQMDQVNANTDKRVLGLESGIERVEAENQVLRDRIRVAEWRQGVNVNNEAAAGARASTLAALHIEHATAAEQNAAPTSSDDAETVSLIDSDSYDGEMVEAETPVASDEDLVDVEIEVASNEWNAVDSEPEAEYLSEEEAGEWTVMV
jgi:hypothetical protein